VYLLLNDGLGYVIVSLLRFFSQDFFKGLRFNNMNSNYAKNDEWHDLNFNCGFFFLNVFTKNLLQILA